MTIKDFSAQLELINNQLNRNYPADKKEKIFGRVIKTQEEFGEFCNEVLAYFGKQRKSKLDKMKPEKNMQKEWADIIFSLFTIACEMNWNVDKILASKLKHINKRHKIK